MRGQCFVFWELFFKGLCSTCASTSVPGPQSTRSGGRGDGGRGRASLRVGRGDRIFLYLYFCTCFTSTKVQIRMCSQVFKAL